MIIELDATIRVPIEIEAVVRDVMGDVRLTTREKETLDRLLKGWGNKEISNELHISVRTVKAHVSSLLAKFALRSRLELLSLFATAKPGENKPGENHEQR